MPEESQYRNKFKVSQAAQAYLDKHFNLRFFEPLDINSCLKYKCDLFIVKNSSAAQQQADERKQHGQARNVQK